MMKPFTALGFLILAVSCTPKNVPLQEHETALEARAAGDSAPNTDQGPDRQPGAFSSLSDEELHARVSNSMDQLLVDSVLRDQRARVSRANRVLLGELNELMLTQLSRGGPEASANWARYRSSVLDACFPMSLEGCRNLAFFRQDPRSATVLGRGATLELEEVRRIENQGTCLSAECRRALLQLYQTLQGARHFRNGLPTPEADMLYLSHALEFQSLLQAATRDASLLRDLGVPRASASLAQSHLRRHLSEMNRIWISSSEADPAHPGIRRFVDRFQPWSFSRRQNRGLPTAVVEQVFSYAARHLLFDTDEVGNTMISGQLKEALLREQGSQQIGSEPSFGRIVRALTRGDEELKFPANPTLFVGLGLNGEKLQSDSILDAYFFIVDRLYRGDLGLSETTRVWQAIADPQKEAKFLSAVRDYMSVRVLYMIATTNAFMGERYARPRDPNELAQQVVSESEQLRLQWDQMMSGFSVVLNFLASNVSSRRGELDAKKLTQDLVNSMKKNIQMLAVYPHMSMLKYFMEDRGSKLRIMTFFGPVEIDVGTIIEAFYDGRIAPWFSFGTDGSGINRFEIVYSYYFSLFTGTVDAFSARKRADGLPAVDRRQFFQRVLSRYLLRDVEAMNEGLNKFQRTISGSQLRGEYMRVCQRLQAGSDDFTLTIPLDELGAFTAVGSPTNTFSQNSRALGRVATDFYSDWDGASARLQAVRGHVGPDSSGLGVRQKAIMVENLAHVLRGNYEFLIQQARTKATASRNMAEGPEPTAEETFLRELEAEAKATSDEADAVLNRLRTLSRQTYDLVLSQHRQLADCEVRMTNLERQQIVRNLEAEGDYLSRVYDEIRNLQSLQGEARSQRLNELNRRPELQGRDAFTERGYRYSQLGFYLRLRERLAQQRPSIQVILPGAGLEEDLRRLPYFARVVELNAAGASGPLSREEFVSQGLKMMNGRENPFASWIQNNFQIKGQLAKIKAMVELYRTDREMGYQAPNAVTAQEVVQEVARALRAVHIDESEARILSQMGLTSKVERDQLHGFLMNSTATEVYDPLDRHFDELRDARIIYNSNKELADTFQAQGLFLFRPPTSLPARIRQSVREPLVRHEQLVQDFLRTVDEAEASGAAVQNLPPTGVVYEIAAGVTGEYRPISVHNPSPRLQGRRSLIGTQRRNGYRDFIQAFHVRQTAGFLRAHRGDPECEGPTATRPQDNKCDQEVPLGDAWN